MSKKLSPLGFVLILLFLRIPLLFMGVYGIISETFSQVVFLVFTYLFTAIFIEKYSDKLEKYFITPSSVIIFILAPFLGIISSSGEPITYIKAIIAGVLGYFLYKKGYFLKIKINKSVYNKRNILLLLVFLSIFIGMENYLGYANINLFKIEPTEFIQTFIFQISFAAVSEEPLFRGIMMGEMLKRKIHPALAILLQGGIFWFGHLYYINTGLNFWIIHPIMAIMLGIIAYKAKSITNSMVFHGICNTLGSLFLKR